MERNFNNIYNELVQNGIEELKTLKEKRITATCILICIIGAMLIFFKKLINNELAIILLIISAIAACINLTIKDNKYKKAFKSSIMGKMVHLYNNNLTYNDCNGVGIREYRASRYLNDFDEFYTEDLIRGRIKDNLEFAMSQIRLVKEEIERDSDGTIKRTKEEVFKGLFGYVDISGKMLPQIEIKGNNFLNRLDKNRIEVDSAEFEKAYDMFTTDKIQTMEIFTSEIIDEMNKFKDDTGYGMDVRVLGSKMFFRISCGECFEAPLFKEAFDYGFLYKYFRMIDGPIHIIEMILDNADLITR